jgi:hypothetical protein
LRVKKVLFYWSNLHFRCLWVVMQMLWLQETITVQMRVGPRWMNISLVNIAAWQRICRKEHFPRPPTRAGRVTALQTTVISEV